MLGVKHRQHTDMTTTLQHSSVKKSVPKLCPSPHINTATTLTWAVLQEQESWCGRRNLLIENRQMNSQLARTPAVMSSSCPQQVHDMPRSCTDRCCCVGAQVLAEVQRRTADSMNRSADNFERYEAATNLHVPPELYLQQVRLKCH
jgi:hypothetical protein